MVHSSVLYIFGRRRGSLNVAGTGVAYPLPHPLDGLGVGGSLSFLCAFLVTGLCRREASGSRSRQYNGAGVSSSNRNMSARRDSEDRCCPKPTEPTDRCPEPPPKQKKDKKDKKKKFVTCIHFTFTVCTMLCNYATMLVVTNVHEKGYFIFHKNALFAFFICKKPRTFKINIRKLKYMSKQKFECYWQNNDRTNFVLGVKQWAMLSYS